MMKLKNVLKKATILAVLAAMLATGVVFADDIANDIDSTRYRLGNQIHECWRVGNGWFLLSVRLTPAM